MVSDKSINDERAKLVEKTISSEQARNFKKTEIVKRAKRLNKSMHREQAALLEKPKENKRAILSEKPTITERFKQPEKSKGEARMKTEKVKLMNIVVDPNIQVREIDEHAVNKYAQAMKVGAQFPPLLLEAKTNRIVCGNHRYRAYQSIYEPDREVSATFQSFECEADIVRAAARDNARHGLPLTTWDQKRIWMRLKEYGDTKEQIAELLSIPVHKIEKWAGLTVVVIGNGSAPRQKPVPISKAAKDVPPKEAPLKHGLEHMAGKTVKQSDYKNHEKRDMGISVKNMAAMITRHVTAGWIDVEDPKTMENLRALHAALEKLLNGKGFKKFN